VVGYNYFNPPLFTFRSAIAVKGNGETFIRGPLGVNGNNTGYDLYVDGTAAKTSGTLWTNVSDARLKDVDGPYERGLQEVLRLRPVRYHYKKNNPVGLPSEHAQIGFLAQEVQPIFPEAVSESKDGYLHLDAHPILISFVNAIQDLHTELLEEKEKNRDLQAQIDALRDTVTRLAVHLEQTDSEPVIKHASR
jgi:hypothetical protein